MRPPRRRNDPSIGARPIYFDHRGGGRSVISTSLQPINPEAFRTLKLPLENPTAWAQREKIAINKLCYALGYKIKEVLVDVLSDSSNASRYGFSVPGIARSTRWLRTANGSPSMSALRDTGALLRGLRVAVPPTGERRITIDFTGSSPSGSRSGSLPAAHVAYLVEFGHTIIVTAKMRSWFMRRAREAGLSLGAKKVGDTIVVGPRPFLQQSVRAGTQNFQREYLTQGGAARMLYDMYFGSGGKVMTGESWMGPVRPPAGGI